MGQARASVIEVGRGLGAWSLFYEWDRNWKKGFVFFSFFFFFERMVASGLCLLVCLFVCLFVLWWWLVVGGGWWLVVVGGWWWLLVGGWVLCGVGKGEGVDDG